MPDTMLVACPACDTLNRVPRARLGDHGTCGKCGKPLFAGKPLPLDEARYGNHAERADLPVLIDFWASWCGPCRMMAPIFEQAAAELEPALRFAKVDTEAAPDLAARFGVRSIPTLVLVRHGEEIARVSGAMPLPALCDWIARALRDVRG